MAPRGELLLRGGLVFALIAILFVQLFAVNQRTSMCWDEGHHLFDGYTILRHRDFGLNPEVPPMAKMVAAAPVVGMKLYVPVRQGRDSQLEAYTDGRDFLFRNDANQLLTRGRMAIAIFTYVLALLVFLAGQGIFGTLTGLLALALLVFDPNLLAHGALVTTDAAITCLVFAGVYAWWRYLEGPSAGKLLLTGVVTGLALATKFTGLFLAPVFALMALAMWCKERDTRRLVRTLGRLALVGIVGYGVLWGFYGFRYAARPDGRVQNPSLTDYLKTYATVANPKPLVEMARFHVLPEAYIWGLANTKLTEERNPSYLFGRLTRHGQRMYFPAAIAIKSTLPFLALMVLAVVVAVRDRALRWKWLMLLVPVAVFLALAMHSDMNIGVRHILPIYPFLYLIGASALCAMVERDRRWIAAAALLLVFQVVTSVRVFPAYMAYANEAWGGPDKVHLYLSESNSDWAQELKTAAAYLKKNDITDCWMAYTASGVADERYYGVNCKRLPTVVNLWWIKLPLDVPKQIEGTVLISDDQLEGLDLQFGNPNPYEQFRRMKPVATLDGGILVYQGRFDVPLASSLVDIARPQPGPK